MADKAAKPGVLTDEDRRLYEWQLSVTGFGEAGQARLKGATALVSRVGGLGGPVAMSLAAAGVGRLILVHGGELKESDLNRQILMRRDGVGRPRVEMAKRRLEEFNPSVRVEAVAENMNEGNAERLVREADIVFDCAPLFAERFAMNAACVRLGRPLVEAAMYELEGRVTVVLPGETACVRCVHPEEPAGWTRKFPVFGAVSAAAGAIAAMEGIKILAGMKSALAGVMLYFDLGNATFRKAPLSRRPECPVCGGAARKGEGGS